MVAIRDKTTGRYKRQIKEWSIENWDDGFVNNKGRFLVYKPKSKYVLYQGYVLRYYAVWESLKGDIPDGYVIHHIDGNKTNDSIENLKLITKKEHDEYHINKQKTGLWLNCTVCKKRFYKPQWRMNQKGHSGKYCTKECRNKRGKIT